MKKLALLLTFSVFVISAYTQQNIINTDLIDCQYGVDESVHFKSKHSIQSNQNRSINSVGGDTLWIEDFSDMDYGAGGSTLLPVGWSASDESGIGTWVPVSNDFGQAGAYTDAEDVKLDTNGYVTLPADFYNCVPGTGPEWEMVASPVNLDATLTSASIDVSSFNTEAVKLMYTTNFRLCCSPADTKLDVMVSSDDGATWTIFDGRVIGGESIVINNQPGNPSEWSHDITNLIAGKSAIKIAFRMSGGSHYFWSIDDVRIVQKQANDVQLLTNFVQDSNLKTLSHTDIEGSFSSLDFYSQRYAKVPYNISLKLHLGALLHQDGISGTNTRVEFNIKKDGVAFWNGNSVGPNGTIAVIPNFVTVEDTVMYSDTSSNFANGPIIYNPSLDEAYFDNNNYKAEGIPYQITFNALSDNPDFNNQDNKDTFNIAQTFGIFSYSHQPTVGFDLDKIESISSFDYILDETDGDEFVVNYKLSNYENTDDFKIYGVRTFLRESTELTFNGDGTGVRLEPVLYLYDDEEEAYLPIEEVSGVPYTINSIDVDSYVYFPFLEDEVDAYNFVNGEYLIGLRVESYNGQMVSFGVDKTNKQGRLHFLYKLVGEDWSAGFHPYGSVMMDLYTQKSQMDFDEESTCPVCPHTDFYVNTVDACIGTTLSFTDNSSQSPSSWSWNFGDGTTSDIQNPTHVYNSVGVYSVSLVASNANGNDIEYKYDYITIQNQLSLNSQPNGNNICVGESYTFSVEATGENLTYQWQKNGTNISGANQANYTISGASSADIGNYSCFISNTCGNVTSNTAYLNVYSTTVITNQPNSLSVSEGSNASFTLIAEGDNLSYQWKKNGFNLPSEVSNALNIPNVNTSNEGDYACVVSGECGGAVMSDVVSLTINASLSININTTNASCGNSDGSASVSVSGGSGSYSYLWSNGSTSTFAQDLSAGTHSVQVTDNSTNYSETNFITINNSDGPSISTTEIHNTCFGDSEGSIQLNISGGAAPYQIEWSNGATTGVINNLSSGTYSVSVIDAEDCFTSVLSTITEPNPIQVDFSTTNSTCGNADGSVFADVSGGTGAYSYLWSNGNNSSYNSSLAAGTYSLSITDNNNCQEVFTTGFSDVGGPIVSVDNVTSAGCNQTGNIQISVSGGSGNYNYNWSNGQSNQDLFNVSPGMYWLTLTDGACITNFEIELPLIYPQEQPICVVTVDPITNKNLIVWEKVQTTGIDHYNIYRETAVINEYDLVGSVPFADMSEFSDSIANPFYRSWTYKISAVDACGNESDLSLSHKTIHLNINLGLGGANNLIWDDYEGLDYSSFSINRHTTADGWEEITQLPTNLHSFTDTPEDLYGLWYSVTISTPSSCVPTSSSRATGGPYFQSSSNIEDEGAVDTKLMNIEDNIKIYPNPTSGDVQILGVWMDEIEILNTSGQVVLKKEVNAKYIRLDLSTQAAGIYYIKIIGKANTFVQKLILE